MSSYLRHALRVLAVLIAPLSLSGCDYALLNPAGPIGAEERSILLLATALMLIVVVPVILMTIAFAWRYRASNKAATYAPEWEHSNRIEVIVWLVPCVIISALAYVTWTTTHRLDPYRPLVSEAKPVEVEVVSLDWKWLFIYPDLKIATVNELAFPANVPVRFRLTSSAVMNSFFIPRLGTMIYTMPGMETKLSLMADQTGSFDGFSTNFSGDGFSGMNFTARSMSQEDFQAWVDKVRQTGSVLSHPAYRELAKPSEDAAVTYYGDIDSMVYHDALNKCTDGSACIDQQMSMLSARDAFGDPALCGLAPSKGL